MLEKGPQGHLASTLPRPATPPRLPDERPDHRTSAPGKPRSGCITATGTSPTTANASTVANVAVARELAGFLWAAMTNQPLRATDSSAVNHDQLQEAAA